MTGDTMPPERRKNAEPTHVDVTLDSLVQRIDDLAARVTHLERTGTDMKIELTNAIDTVRDDVLAFKSDVKTAIEENTSLTRALEVSARGAMKTSGENAAALVITNASLKTMDKRFDDIAGSIDMVFSIVKSTPFWTKVMQFVIAIGGTYAMVKALGL